MGTRYVGQILMFAGNFAPQGFQLCDGSLLQISDNDTLFNLIGTTYGGDGQSTFGVPDLRGRAPISQGTGGGATYPLAASGGQETVTLNTNQLPVHSHPATTTGVAATSNVAASNTIFADQSGSTTTTTYAAASAGSPVALSGQSIGAMGGNQPHDNRQPYLAINYCISLYGIYPSPT